MSRQNGQSPAAGDPLADILEPVRDRVSELVAERNRVKVELDLLDEEIRRCERVIHAADPKSKPGPKKKSGSGTSSVSEANVTIVLAAIREHAGDEPFVSADVVGWAGVSDGVAKNAVVELRKRELVRLMGRVPAEPGQRGLTPYRYQAISE